MDLKEWTIQFIKNKDIIQKKILEIKDNGNTVEVIFKDNKRQLLFIQPDVKLVEVADALEQSTKDPLMFVSIVCLNKRTNLQELIKNWQRIVDFPQLSMYFVNPESATDKKWMIYPHTHHKISDPSSLKLGLESMFSTVQEVV